MVLIFTEHSPCFGFCPKYIVYINSFHHPNNPTEWTPLGTKDEVTAQKRNQDSNQTVWLTAWFCWVSEVLSGESGEEILCWKEQRIALERAEPLKCLCSPSSRGAPSASSLLEHLLLSAHLSRGLPSGSTVSPFSFVARLEQPHSHLQHLLFTSFFLAYKAVSCSFSLRVDSACVSLGSDGTFLTPLSPSVKGNNNVSLAGLGFWRLNETNCVKLPGTQ